MSRPISRQAIPVILFLLMAFSSGCAIVSEPRTTLPTAAPSLAPSTSGNLLPTSSPQPVEATATAPTIPTLAPDPATVEPPVPELNAESFPTGSIAYVLPLTIRHVIEDRASLFFELSAPSAGSVFYQQLSPQPGEVRSVSLDPSATRQMILLEGLSPGEEYTTLVGLGDESGGFQQPPFLAAPWGSVRFRTPDGREPLRVAVVSDASFGDAATEALVAQIAARELDFVIDAGDIVDKIEEQSSPLEAYALKYYQTLSPLLHRLPVYNVPGNHDYDANARWLESYFYYYAFPAFPEPRFSDPGAATARQYYAFAYNDIQFLMLDTQVFFGIPGWESQEDWLSERLSDPRFRFSIPILHVPPFFSGSVHPDDQLPVRQFWHPMFAAARVPLALSGHSHHYERLQSDGITYIVTGGGSNTLYPAGAILPNSQMFAARTHFTLLEIYSDRIELSAIDKTGEQFDQAVIPLQ